MLHLDLFSGIGGFALAVDTVWPGAEHIFCDNNKFCQQVLRKHWPNAKIYTDIKGLTFTPTYDILEIKGGYHGTTEKREIRRGGEDVLPGNVNRRGGGILRNNPSSNVENPQEERGKIQRQFMLWGEESFLSGNEGGRSGAEYIREGDSKGNNSEENTLRDMPGNGDIQGRKEQNTVSSPRLRKTSGSDVALPNLSPQMAQRKYSEGIELNERPFILTAGVPCQPASCAGKRKGREDDRWLWPETFRIISETQPRFVILENVRGILTLESGMVFQSLLSEMESLNYEARVYIIPACAVNAPHRRDRVWIVAHSINGRLQKRRPISNESMDGSPKTREETGNFGPKVKKPDWTRNWLEVATELCRVDDGLPVELDGFKLTKAGHRVERLKALGNSIVPQVAIEIMKAIKEAE